MGAPPGPAPEGRPPAGLLPGPQWPSASRYGLIDLLQPRRRLRRLIGGGRRSGALEWEAGMVAKLNKNDRALLAELAKYRLLTVSQIAGLCTIGKPAARKRVGKLVAAGLATERTPALARRRGRPERWVSLTVRGIDWLKEQGVLGRVVPHDEITADNIRCAEHLLAVNWFWIHLVHVTRTTPPLSADFASATFPHLNNEEPIPVTDRVPAGDPESEDIEFTPDGVFTLRNEKTRKTLLFFLEVDLGTEILASNRPTARDIRTKISCYQQYFRLQGYKRYETVWGCELHGFRLLFLTHTPARLAALCGLVEAMSPSDFIWLTDQNRLFDGGLSADVWARGGKREGPGSIVGRTLSHVAPLVDNRPQGPAESRSLSV